MEADKTDSLLAETCSGEPPAIVFAAFDTSLRRGDEKQGEYTPVQKVGRHDLTSTFALWPFLVNGRRARAQNVE